MKFKRAIVLFLFIFPIFILIGLVAYRKQHPANISYGEPIFSASSNQVSKTLNDWNLINSDEYLDVTDRQTIKAKLDELFQRHNLSEQQINEGETSSLDLLESLKTGNYDQFIKVRVPSQEVEVSDAVLKGLQHYSGLAASGSPFDYYQKIWKDTFKTNSFWSQILFDSSNAVILKTNLNIQENRFTFPIFAGSKGNAYLEAYTTIAFDYKTLEQQELGNNKRLLIWSLFFMGKEPNANQARPFMVTFFWSSSANKWIPIDFVHGFIKNPTVKFRFF